MQKLRKRAALLASDPVDVYIGVASSSAAASSESSSSNGGSNVGGTDSSQAAQRPGGTPTNGAEASTSGIAHVLETQVKRLCQKFQFDVESCWHVSPTWRFAWHLAMLQHLLM